MVIGDDEGEAEGAGGFGFFDAGDSAVDGDDDIASLGRDCAQRVVVEAVAFVDAIGDVGVCSRSELLEAEKQDRAGSNTVGVVVAVDSDASAGVNGSVNQLGSTHRAGEFFGIAQAAEFDVEESPHAVDIADTAANEKLSDDGRDASGILESGDAGRIVTRDSPALGHRASLREVKSGESRVKSQTRIAALLLALDSPLSTLDYFFFSVCSVCLRRRGLNFLSFSFSPPVLRRRV